MDANESHPTWVRGLKYAAYEQGLIDSGVAPHVGAWIEISSAQAQGANVKSHPTWVRGLK